MDKQRINLVTHNPHKVGEIKEILGDGFEILTLKDLGITEEPVEDGKTIQENASIKANFLKNRENDNSIIMADDTGLFVDALDGAPGVYSARYAGENCSYSDNNKKLLEELEGIDNRSAHFDTSIALIFPDGTEEIVTGSVPGDIALKTTGIEGFGYDPLFIEKNSGKTYSEMGQEEKNGCSHRSKALELARERITNWLENETNRTGK